MFIIVVQNIFYCIGRSNFFGTSETLSFWTSYKQLRAINVVTFFSGKVLLKVYYTYCKYTLKLDA